MKTYFVFRKEWEMADGKGPSKVLVKATPIELAIKKYNVTDVALVKLKKKCMEIKVIDPEDKKGYALAHDTRIEVKGIRVTIEKTRVESQVPLSPS